MVNMSANFDEVSFCVHKLISLYVHCDLEFCPVTSKINRIYSFAVVNMSAKFDEETHNGLV